jgi:cobyrinic acid a,c-diamide synthase
MKNRSMRDSIVEASKKGIQLYGECGGLIYLLEKLIDTEGRAFTMCGVVKGSCKMEKRRQGLGYVTVHAQSDNLLCNRGDTFRAHEFHWSRLVDVPQATVFAYETRKSNGKRQGTDGIGEKNIFVSYTHVHFSSNRRLAINLLTSMAKKTGS